MQAFRITKFDWWRDRVSYGIVIQGDTVYIISIGFFFHSQRHFFFHASFCQKLECKDPRIRFFKKDSQKPFMKNELPNPVMKHLWRGAA